MRITRLKPQRRDSRRVSVFLDGAYSFSLDNKTATRLGLRVGMDVKPQDLDRILYEGELQRAKDYALLLLSYRARTVHELQSRLLRRKFRPEVATAAVGRLVELKLVDDAQFARDFVRDRIALGRRGKRLVHLELIRFGVSEEDIARAMEQAPDECESARELVKKYRTRYAKLEPRTRKQRLYALLARRGFSPDTISEALELSESEA